VDVSKDESRIAILNKHHGKSSIRIVHPSGETEREFIVEQSGVEIINCSVDGKGLYLSVTPQPGVSAPYYTDLQGQARLLWQQKGRFGLSGFQPFPDGRYLAMGGATAVIDAWWLENFLVAALVHTLCFSSSQVATPCQKTH